MCHSGGPSRIKNFLDRTLPISRPQKVNRLKECLINKPNLRDEYLSNNIYDEEEFCLNFIFIDYFNLK